jgi:hypothetical protein
VDFKAGTPKAHSREWAFQSRKSRRPTLASEPSKPRQRPTLPQGCPYSTIGPEKLNFRVRDGNGCDLFGIAARKKHTKCEARPTGVERLQPAGQTDQTYAPRSAIVLPLEETTTSCRSWVAIADGLDLLPARLEPAVRYCSWIARSRDARFADARLSRALRGKYRWSSRTTD